MPFPRQLRPSFSQFLLNHPYNSHHSHISSPYAHKHGHRPRPAHRHGQTRRAFSTSSPSLASPREPTYYELLDVPVTATTAEIKKKFYSLSLRHHPDRNRDDPTASARFARISSAYHVLSNAAKRSAYDRDNGIHSFSSQTSTHSTAHPGQHPMGSHSSYSYGKPGASYFGSRPASGLSKRRGAFRGPPPSFYAHGGYGNRKPPPPPPGRGGTTTGAAGGAGRGSSSGGGGGEDDPTSFIYQNPVSHFNARGHYRTQVAEDARRQERRSRQMKSDINYQLIGGRGDFALRFLAVCGILVAAGLSTMFGHKDKAAKGKKNMQGKDH